MNNHEGPVPGWGPFKMLRWARWHIPPFVRLLGAWLLWLLIAAYVAEWLHLGGHF